MKRALCLCLAAIVLALSGCGGDSAANGTTEWIFFASNDGTNTYLNRVHPDGSAQGVQVKLGPNYQGFAANAAGDSVAFGYSVEPFNAGPTYSICVGPAPSAAAATFRSAYLYDSVGSLQFSDDGRYLLYTAAPTGESPALFRLDLLTKAIVRLDDGIDMQLSPDGKTILYSKAVGSGIELFTLPILAVPGSGAQLTSDGRIKQLPSWSADGTRIAYVGYQDAPPYAGYVVSALGADEGKQPIFSNPTADVFGIAFAPDGKRVATIQLDGTTPSKTGVYVSQDTGAGTAQIVKSAQVTGPVFWKRDASGPLAAGQASHSLIRFARITPRRASRVRPVPPR